MKSTSMVREARVRTIPSVGTSKIDRHASLRAKTIRLSNGNEIRTLREDGGVSQSRLAAAAGISQSFVSTIEAGTALPSVEILSRLAAGLGADLQVRLYPNTGLPIRDRIQSAMIEALLRELHPRWAATLEVPVRRPARGVIDLVLRDRGGTTMIAVELNRSSVASSSSCAGRRRSRSRSPPRTSGTRRFRRSSPSPRR